MRAVPLLLLSLVAPVWAMPPKRKRTDKPKPNAPTPPPEYERVTISFTLTPTKRGGIDYTDAEAMDAVERALNEINSEMLIRIGDGVMSGFYFSRERGNENNNAHSNGHGDYNVPVEIARDKKRLADFVKREAAWMRGILRDGVDDVSFRVRALKVNPKDHKKVYGYDQKDTGLAHFMFVTAGFTDEWLAEALDLWRSIAGSCSFSSKKANKTPNAESKLLAYTVGNIMLLVDWFVKKHELAPIARYLYPSLIIAWSMQTGRYCLDDSLLNGRNGGVTLDPRRAHAFYELRHLDPRDIDTNGANVTVPLIDTVLFGCPQPHPQAHDVECIRRGLPTTGELVELYSLSSAKVLCQRIEERACTGTDVARRSGRFIVIDFLASDAAESAARTMEQAGLSPKRIFRTDQRPDACGYNSAGWSSLLHGLGDAFQTLDVVTASQVNTDQVIRIQNERLGKPELGEKAIWLSGDQILYLVEHGPGAGQGLGGLHHRWLSGPGPLNYWKTHFARTLAEAQYHGRVHIMVVNTESQHSLSDFDSGRHWFVVAWYIEPENEDGAAY